MVVKICRYLNSLLHLSIDIYYISESIFKIKKFATSDNSTNEIEQVSKYVLIQTPFKLKKQEEQTIAEKTSIAWNYLYIYAYAVIFI